MAKPAPSAKPSVITVEWGDTLSQIAVDYLGAYSKYWDIARLNGIKNPNIIHVGQKIKLYGTASASSSSTSSSNSNKAVITQFGLLAASSEHKLVAVWTWAKSNDHTENYEYEWEYTMKGTGGTWWTGAKQSTEDLECMYTIPDDAEQVRFRVKPVSEKRTQSSNSKEVSYWTAEWTAYSTYNTDQLPPDVPSGLSAELDTTDKLKLNMRIDEIDADNLDATHVQFQVVRIVDGKISKYHESGSVEIDKTYKYVSYSCALSAGAEYKVRCRSLRGNLASEWSAYTSGVSTAPSKPSGFTVCKAKSSSTDGKVSVYLEWNAVSAATKYKIEYATSEEYFDGTDQTTTIDNIELTHYETYGLYTGSNGAVYYFRLKAVNEGGESDWSAVSSVAVGEAPDAPTTWSSTSTATVGGPLNLYWVHNSKDGSSQTYAQLALEIYAANGLDEEGNIKYELKWSKEIEIANSTAVDEKDKTSSFDAAAYLQEEVPNWYKEGVQLRWRVRTRGVVNKLGKWSVVRMIDIYAKPTVSLEVRDGTNTINTTFDTLGAFPIYISAATQPKTQAPIGFYITIISNTAYETIDNVGNDKVVNVGDQVYSDYFDRDTDLDNLMLSAGDIDLENGANYTITCTVAMNSGLTADASLDFSVSWEEVSYIPNATIEYDSERIMIQLRPYCDISTTTYYAVEHSSDIYTATDIAVSVLEGSPIDAYTTTGERVYLGSTEITIDENGNVTGGEDVYYYVSVTSTPVEGVSLAVYRREFDGSFTELASGIDNTKNTYIIDPHPALDYARYRIVSTTDATGAVSYYDMPGYAIQEKAVIIQWNEDWSSFDAVADATPADPPWSGSLLKLPYNIDVSDSYGADVSLVQYAGRKRPVSYYGTQLGESSTWNTVIPKDDIDTLYALRRLAIWAGDCYVREPSGTGYWANVTVSFNQKHLDLTIPVTLTIKRVEGGA